MRSFTPYAVYGRMLAGVLVIIALAYIGVPNA